MPGSIGKYMTATIVPELRVHKTHEWVICGSRGVLLGRVAWYSGWRQYVFRPDGNTEYNAGCLRDLAAFLDKCNAEQRKGG